MYIAEINNKSEVPAAGGLTFQKLGEPAGSRSKFFFGCIINVTVDKTKRNRWQ
jgi:hypothetical protein